MEIITKIARLEKNRAIYLFGARKENDTKNRIESGIKIMRPKMTKMIKNKPVLWKNKKHLKIARKWYKI